MKIYIANCKECPFKIKLYGMDKCKFGTPLLETVDYSVKRAENCILDKTEITIKPKK